MNPIGGSCETHKNNDTNQTRIPNKSFPTNELCVASLVLICHVCAPVFKMTLTPLHTLFVIFTTFDGYDGCVCVRLISSSPSINSRAVTAATALTLRCHYSWVPSLNTISHIKYIFLSFGMSDEREQRRRVTPHTAT